nr:hypothetical protein [uncultured Oscillibacter sp.]
MKKPFVPRRMMPGKAVNFDFSKTAYEQEPDKYFIYEREDDDMGGTDVFSFWNPRMPMGFRTHRIRPVKGPGI